MKIGILGSPKAIESLWLEEEAKKRGHSVNRFTAAEFTFGIEKNNFVLDSPYELKSFDIFLVRGIFRSYFVDDLYFNKSTESLLLLRYINDILKKPIVDERLAKRPMIMSKMATALDLTKENLPQPRTLQFPHKRAILANLESIPYPVMIKNPAGRKGKNIYKIESKGELRKFLQTMPNLFPFQFQEFLPTDGDIRVLVIGYKAIGAMKRHLVKGGFVANISQGADAEKFELTREAKEIAEKAAKVTETEYAGVDLIESKGKYYVIEVNRSPQFRGFRKYTKLDPSPFIIDYLEQKASKYK
jgi:RimK family alpha-L-glutamate ligase